MTHIINSRVLINYRETKVRNRIRNRIKILAETYYEYSRPYSVRSASIGLAIGLSN